MLLFTRLKQDTNDGDATTCKNSFNNPAYYILEGVPNQSAALASDLLSGSAGKSAPPSGGAGKGKPPSGSSVQARRQTSGRPVRPISEEGSSEEDGIPGVHSGSSSNHPPPDFPPPPLPKGALEMSDTSFFPPAKESKPRLHPDLADIRIPPPTTITSKPLSSPGFAPNLGGGGAFCLDPSPSILNPSPAPFRRGGGASVNDQSCSVLHLAKKLSEVEYPPGQDPGPGGAVKKGGVPTHLRGIGLGDACRTFPPRSIQEESIAEDLPEEVRKTAEKELGLQLTIFWGGLYFPIPLDIIQSSINVTSTKPFHPLCNL